MPREEEEVVGANAHTQLGGMLMMRAGRTDLRSRWTNVILEEVHQDFTLHIYNPTTHDETSMKRLFKILHACNSNFTV
jgi:hypothetical protein